MPLAPSHPRLEASSAPGEFPMESSPPIPPKSKASKQGRERLDILLVQRGLVESRQKAQALIMAGEVRVDGLVVTKAGQPVPAAAQIQISSPLPYVSRGGLKLEAALDHFGIQVDGRTVMDVGASTGGFTDCLLKRGARRILAVDVGHGQLHPRLRQDPRVVVMEKTNIRYLNQEDLEEPPEMATVDVSFISLRLVIPAVARLLGGEILGILTLVKPQFEVGKKEVGRGGVVRERGLHERVLEEIAVVGGSMGFSPSAPFPSPVLGPKGNQEFFLWFTRA
jgi:23S rRNA (cytidine1920-2'-O)/16S rRNA (cytidine1409-2'-O)-methyltransferase